MTLIWKEADHPEYSRFKGTRVRGYSFSERRTDGGLLCLVLDFESGSVDPVRREIEELTGLEVTTTYITTKDGVGAEAVGDFKMRMYGNVFFVYLEEEVNLNVNNLTIGEPTGQCRLVFSKTPRLIGDLPRRPYRQRQQSLDFFQE